MDIDLDKVSGAAADWSLVFTIGCAQYCTRPPTIGELRRLAELGALPQAETFELVAGLFNEPKPSIAALTPRQYNVVISTYCKHAADWLNRTCPRPSAATEHKPTRPAIPQRPNRRFL